MLLRFHSIVVTGQVDEDGVFNRQSKRKSCTPRRSQYVIRSVDDITEEDLDNIAYRSKDKIWDKENVSRILYDFTLYIPI